MFSEILRIKPVLDSATSKRMESSLTQRFRNVARKFGRGLKAVIKGSILGISLGLLSRLLNPLEALEEKIESLLNQGRDLTDLADKFGASPGELKQLQVVAQSLGLDQASLTDMMTKFASAIETAREELADPYKERSAATKAVEEFVNEENMVQNFKNFLASLKAEGLGAGREVVIGDQVKTRKQLSGSESRRYFERQVFGEAQSGASRRLIEADFGALTDKLKIPTSEELNRATAKLDTLDMTQRALAAQNELKDFIASTNTMQSYMIKDIEARKLAEEERNRKDFLQFETLSKAATALDILKSDFKILMADISRGIGYLSELIMTLRKWSESTWFKKVFGGR